MRTPIHIQSEINGLSYMTCSISSVAVHVGRHLLGVQKKKIYLVEF